MPSTPISSGKIKIEANWKIKVLANDKIADTNPLFKAVKNADEKILNPANKNESIYILIALLVNAISSAS